MNFYCTGRKGNTSARARSQVYSISLNQIELIVYCYSTALGALLFTTCTKIHRTCSYHKLKNIMILYNLPINMYCPSSKLLVQSTRSWNPSMKILMEFIESDFIAAFSTKSRSGFETKLMS